jgi:hypothetical protein
MTDDTRVATTGDQAMTFGQTNLRPQDIVPPRVKVVQQMAKEAADKKAEPGDFYNTLTGEKYGPTLRVQPIQLFMQRVFLVRQERREKADKALADASLAVLSEGDGLKCRSFDMFVGIGEPGISCEPVPGDPSIQACPLSQWTKGPKGEQVPPLCTETYNVACATELGDLIILSFSRSSAKVGKRFFSAVRMSPPGVMPWTRFFDLATHQERNDQGTFYVPDFVLAAERPDTALIRQATFWAEQLKGVRVDTIDVTPEDEEAHAGAGPEANPDDPDSPF